MASDYTANEAQKLKIAKIEPYLARKFNLLFPKGAPFTCELSHDIWPGSDVHSASRVFVFHVETQGVEDYHLYDVSYLITRAGNSSLLQVDGLTKNELKGALKLFGK